MVIWSILRPFGIFCGHLVYFIVIWYIFPRFGMLYQEKSGNPAFKVAQRPLSLCLGCPRICKDLPFFGARISQKLSRDYSCQELRH
jgi:hypothetical protein